MKTSMIESSTFRMRRCEMMIRELREKSRAISDREYIEMCREHPKRFVFINFEFEAYGDRSYLLDKVTGEYVSTFRSCGD